MKRNLINYLRSYNEVILDILNEYKEIPSKIKNIKERLENISSAIKSTITFLSENNINESLEHLKAIHESITYILIDYKKSGTYVGRDHNFQDLKKLHLAIGQMIRTLEWRIKKAA